MSEALRQPMGIEDFLDWRERQDGRYEYDGFAPVAMTGGSYAHEIVSANIVGALHPRLRGTPCRVIGSSALLATRGKLRNPDAMIVCGPVDPAVRVIPEPVVVFEVLSPSTSFTDRIAKAREYGATPSIRRYVILERLRMGATVFSHDSGQWVAAILEGETDLALPEVGLTIPLSEFYVDIDFPDPPHSGE